MTLLRWSKTANEYYLMHNESVNADRCRVLLKDNSYHVSYPLENKSVKYGRIVYSSTQLIYPNIITYGSTLQNSFRNYSVRVKGVTDAKIKGWLKLAVAINPFTVDCLVPLTPIRIPQLTMGLSGGKEYSLAVYSRTDTNMYSKKFRMHSIHLGYMNVEDI